MPIQDYTSYSWRIIDDNSATKQCDKSFFEHCGTGVPQDILWFFGVDSLNPGDRKPITLFYEGKPYAAHFIVDRYSRVRLFWENTLGSSVAGYKTITPYPLALYEKVDETHYNVRMLVGTERLSFRKPVEWFLPVSPRRYDFIAAFNDLVKVDWPHRYKLRNIEVNDIVYIYTANPVSRITHHCIVNRVNIPHREIDDRQYQLRPDNNSEGEPFFELQCIRAFDELDGLTFSELSHHGLTGVQDVQLIKEDTSSHLQAMIAEQNAIDRFSDGQAVYMEAMRLRNETINTVIDEDAAVELTEDALRQVAIQHQSHTVTERRVTTVQRQRNPYIAEYAKRRANGRCQLCGNPAPFTDGNGKPYLESHHIVWLSDGGADTIENTVALCPNCHRKMHVLNDPKDVAKLKATQ